MSGSSMDDSVIRILADHVVDHIAAGEVVERPSAVLKELLENAIDAGATDIRVQIEDGGLSLIQIDDDGCGMSRLDLETCICRHATSKITEPEDLFGIETLGFRGEALSSIAAVSRVQIETKRRADPCGWRLIVHAGEIQSCEEAPVNDGTSIRVTDLFFNTPARRKFLRAPATEQSHVLDASLRVGMAQMHVALQVYNGNRRLLDLPSGVPPGVRLEAALGNRFPDAQHFEHCSNDIAVQGFLAPPTALRNDAKGIWIFVNGRYVRDRMFHRAVSDAFQDRLPSGKHPVLAVYIDIDPSQLDVNVHPQKLEVRFSDGHSVFQTFSEALAIARQIDEWGARSPISPEDAKVREEGVEHAVQRFFESPRGSLAFGERQRSGATRVPAPSTAPGAEKPLRSLPKTVQLGLGMQLGESKPDVPTLNERSHLNQWTELDDGLWSRVKDGSIEVVDLRAHAQQRWKDAALKHAKDGCPSQRNLIPTILEWSTAKVKSLEASFDIFESLGFKLSTFEERRVAVLATPSGLSFGAELETLLSTILEQKASPRGHLVEMLSKFATTGEREAALEEALTEGQIVRLSATVIRQIISR